MSDWIKCSDRMPEIGVIVYTWSKCGEMCEGQYWGDDCIDGGSIWTECRNVTHWQPLPEPPSS